MTTVKKAIEVLFDPDKLTRDVDLKSPFSIVENKNLK